MWLTLAAVILLGAVSFLVALLLIHVGGHAKGIETVTTLTTTP